MRIRVGSATWVLSRKCQLVPACFTLRPEELEVIIRDLFAGRVTVERKDFNGLLAYLGPQGRWEEALHLLQLGEADVASYTSAAQREKHCWCRV